MAEQGAAINCMLKGVKLMPVILVNAGTTRNQSSQDGELLLVPSAAKRRQW